MTCHSSKGICKMFCIGKCDPDTCHELHKEDIIFAADAQRAMHRVQTQGTVDVRLNGVNIATIDPNTSTLSGLPASLSFKQFEFINKIYQAITTQP